MSILILLRWRLDSDHCPISCWWCDFHWQSGSSCSLVDSWVVNLRVANHSDEEWSLLSECMLFAWILYNLNEVIILLLLQQLGCKVSYDFPSVGDVIVGSILCDSAEPYCVTFINRRWNHVKLSRPIDNAQQLLVDLIRAKKTKANQTQFHFVANFETFVFQNELLKVLRQTAVMTNIFLQSGDSICSDYEPKLQRTESSRQRNSPMAIIDRWVRVSVFEIQWVNDECWRQANPITHPQCWAVEVD